MINGRPHGKGVAKYANRSTYKGDFQNGLKNGYGIFTWYDRTKLRYYKGSFANDKFNGLGILFSN